MASPNSPIEHAAVKGRSVKFHRRAISPTRRRSSRDRPEWTWGIAGTAEEGDMTVEVDGAVEVDAWKLSIDMPACHISVQIEGSKQLDQLVEFLGRTRASYPLGVLGELRIPRSSVIWVWDDETSGRLFLWLNRTGKCSIRAVFNQHQVDCIRSALTEATTPG